MLSQSTGYAATALGCVAAMGGHSASVKEVAQACGIPHPYLAKIINILARKGIVQTQRGVGGGMVLARAPQDITLFDLCQALDDPVVEPRCMLGNAVCSEDRTCPAHRFCRTHRKELADFLQATTLADMAAFETRRRWRASDQEPKSASATASR